jgi:23S rRNA pseudouridine1911/1915/1917 synthase
VPTHPIEPLIVPSGDGVRLDAFLARHLPAGSRRRARAAIAAGAVLVNGRPGRKSQALHPGDVVQADLSVLDREPAPQPDLPVPILYEDEAVVAVDKPSGMPSVALRAGDRNTVANFLLGRYPEVHRIGDVGFEAGLVHRLDTATSGVLLAARTQAAWQALRSQFRTRRADKLYLAVALGDLAQRGTIATPIAHRPHRAREMCVCAQPAQARALRARPAVTRYRPLRRGGAATLLAICIPTGVRHQIRVHLASIGHPVVGDGLYGPRHSELAAGRLLLHAARLGISHPGSGRRLVLRSRLPDDFRKALTGLVTGPRGPMA